ncbi:MAG: tRNA (adenosine(37)-N6)-threonylcarbamoyltransferase complex ATPase subunit type 1 TsaE [Thiobacillaceae bacterium]|nr:tRNA (adenosine(37)-N6)-threonylcarbamoyltransferase complex ATPase subunit type 1 TsaE [Thiobacillaceae bacterium]MDW8322472.1 tRNA (adenosine(37)-N6)-threonylcarbamoyltransferase complex ATPase subunit type 1 TsaE [Burkholderiales bacterium]
MTHDGHDSPPSLRRHLPDEAATLALGAALARRLAPGMTVWLTGALGAGKTTLVRGLLRALGYTGRVKSPTFALVEVYPFSSFTLYHFDLYRLSDPLEWEEAGLREYFNARSLCLIEWPERAAGRLPAADVEIRLEFAADGRQALLQGRTEAGRACVRGLAT